MPIQLADPLRNMLDLGPYEPAELLDQLPKINLWFDDGESDDPERDIRFMLERLVESEGRLIPYWWEGSLQEFLSAFHQEYAPNYRAKFEWETPWTPQELQLQILETLLYLWRQERDKGAKLDF